MPAFTATMESAKLINWLIEEGAIVEKGQVLAEVETDKAVAEIESPVAGKVTKILVVAGDDDVDTDTPLVELSDGKDADTETSTPAPEPIPDVPPAPEHRSDEQKIAGAGERVPASPSARRVARDAGVDLQAIKGSGPGGRITKDDVVTHVNSSTLSTQKAKPSDVSSMRLAIAKAMVHSKTSVPHFYTETNVVIDDLARLKQRLCESNPGDRITWTTLLVYCVARALSDVKEARFRWENGNVVSKDSCDIAVAVAVDGGIVAPVVRNANSLQIPEIASKLNQLVTDARSGSLKQSDLGDASLTISNLGMFSIDAFYPIVNVPEPLIIGIGRSRRMPIVVGDSVEIHSVITITQAVDHRVIDGAIAGRFADALRTHIETPELPGVQ
jgi:pyruvate dehydrogenase E2 component (dihydrolipoamide acetyltransferase)